MTTTFLIDQGDVVISEASGSPKMVADDTKLRQDVKEVLSTSVRPENIGAGLEEVINGKPADQFSIRADISRRLRVALDTMQSLQTRFQRDQRPNTERIRRLSLVQVTPLEGTLSAYAFKVAVTTQANTQVSTTGVIS